MTAAFTGSYQIVGVLQKAGEWDQELRIDMLYYSYVQREDAVPKEVLVSREIWVSGNKAAEIGPVLAMELRAGLPHGAQWTVSRSDMAASPDFGASGGRIFASVMMESVVATAVAGVLGIALAVALVRSPLIMKGLFCGLQDVPPFPFVAAIIGAGARFTRYSAWA
ncbi:MAG: hypothetical protein LCH31_01440 [Actinobacteria bacterium]|nr:hypothetical protein [Actinomycetota bacterium]